MKFLDNYGWPIERIRGRRFLRKCVLRINYAIRVMLWCRSIISDYEWEQREAIRYQPNENCRVFSRTQKEA